ncbi:DUF502 domain-containing protein [Pedobacter sp. MR2016-19]|uniref:DUF502 domain-containing protein n=1 Tax=unclassified Pedobacter TaxID=2628915 RepID=UPI001877251B|nr:MULTISPECIES: DUF502 domain-containing protein [unclassified Pedobacter]MBE5322279.1 DUF502 domain-containing protein [Pedobacter sp. MR2016-19]QXU42940.1 DUF502 domain-containing protein [Pedobacter sp. D749]
MNKVGKAILNYLIKGLLIVVPIAVSIFIVVWAVTTVDSWLNVNNILGVNPNTGESRNIPGLGLLTVLALILLAGIFVTNLVTEPMYNWFQRMMQRLPLLNFIYSSIKDLTEAFVGDEKKFNHPVLVEVEGGLKKIGFLTQNDLHKLNLPDEVAVYFPLSYSFAGQLCIVRRDKVTDLQMTAADAMKLVVSGGVSGL